jgi:hypothetical protein
VSSVIETGRVEEAIRFTPADGESLTYALVCDSAASSAQVRYSGCEIAVVLPRDSVMAWARGDQAGIYSSVDLGPHGALDVIVEKDFACMDVGDANNPDTFPNPKAMRAD